MKAVVDRCSLTLCYSGLSNVQYEEDAILFYSENVEERSKIQADVNKLHPSLELCRIVIHDDSTIDISSKSLNFPQLNLRSAVALREVNAAMSGRFVYVDITGFPHGVWAWLLQAIFLKKNTKPFALYSEPLEYKFHDIPLRGNFFDLSERISGIEPLPGLAKVKKYDSNDFIFMPLLGFEGARFAHIFENVQPLREFTFPVIGVPGFQFDFPFHTYQGNPLLERENLWPNRRYEQANCPVSIFLLGSEILSEFPTKDLRIAPIGTKPHALGAVLLRILNKRVDIIYDHPVRKAGRTSGVSQTLCYNLQPFLEYL